MRTRTQEEINAEITALEGCKAYAPKRTFFGEDNHANIDLQIEFLRGDIDTSAEEFDEFSDDEQGVILEAENWLHGGDEAPSAGWDSYKNKK